jgi:hypothetical protein
MGTVTDAETGKALSDVLLRIGSSVAATDPFGHYQFHSLFPGVHRLYIDPASLPSGFIPVENIPMEIIIDGETVQKKHPDYKSIDDTRTNHRVQV